MEKEIQQILKRAGMLTEVHYEENRYGEQVAVAGDRPGGNSDPIVTYPELDEVARDLAIELAAKINRQVEHVPSDMPYKAQYVLEELIKWLQKAV